MKELNLHQGHKSVIDSFTGSLRSAYGDGLVSVILYGSAASGEFSQKHSNINLLVVLDNTGLANLSKMLKTLNSHKFRILNALFFTPEYIRSSADIFPIEFLDMKENYAVLYGEDVLKELCVDSKNLRFQCEQELEAKIISIKNFYLRNAGRAALKDILFRSFTSFLHILRNLIRLKGKTPSYLKPDLLKQAAEEFSIDTANFQRILEAKRGNLKLSRREIEALFINFAADLEKISDIVDKFDA